MLADGTGREFLPHFAIRKARRVVWSAIGAEIFSFADAVGEAVVLYDDLQVILQQYLPLRVVSNSSSLFSVVVKFTITMENPHMIDLHAARETLEWRKITKLGWRRWEVNLADSLTTTIPSHSPQLPAHAHSG